MFQQLFQIFYKSCFNNNVIHPEIIPLSDECDESDE